MANSKRSSLMTTTFLSKVEEVEWMGIDFEDYPDFCDAYITRAIWSKTGKELSEDDLEELNDSADRYELLMKHLY